MLTELAINLVHPNVLTLGLEFKSWNEIYLVDLTYSVNSMLTIFMIVRLYHLVTAFIVSNKYSDSRAQRVRSMNGAIDAHIFAIRSMLTDESLKMISILLLACMLVGGF
jgi:uncharacterized phage infection (PIP) family protein YhgE